METENDNVIPPEVFWKRKIDWFIYMWQCGKDSTPQFIINLVRMGYPEEDVIKYIEDYEDDKE